MFGSAVSRWTMLHFAAALLLFLAAQLAMTAGAAFPAISLLAPTTIAVVHLLTIGWLTVLMLGALHQFIPVIAAKGSVAGASALVSLVLILAGLAGMEAGFLVLAGRLPPAVLPALPAGGALVLGGMAMAAASLARTLSQARPLPFSAWFIAAGLAFLLIAIGMGIVLGLTFAFPGLIGWSNVFTGGFRLHLLAGLVGWFTLTAIGVSYRLLSMFTLAPEERGPLGIAVFVLSAGGLAATWLLDLAAAIGAPVPFAIIEGAAAATGLGIALYLLDMARLYRARRRRMLELNTTMALAALGALGLSLFCAACLAVHGASEALIGAVGYLFLFGWLSGLGLSQLYKIVPFLTWLERYGSILGKQPVPRVQDLVNERRDRPWFLLFFGCVAAAALFAALQWTLPWRLASIGQLAAALMIARALWLVRHGTRGGRTVAANASPASSTSSTVARPSPAGGAQPPPWIAPTRSTPT